MRRAIDLLMQSKALGIRLWAEGKDLRFRAPSGALSWELRDALIDEKPNILAFLDETCHNARVFREESRRRTGLESAGVIPAGDDGPIRKGATIRPVPRPRNFPLSHAQERLWFLYQLEGPSPSFHLSVEIDVSGTIRVPLLFRALMDLVRRYEPLRTELRSDEDGPVQRIGPLVKPSFQVLDLSGLDVRDEPVAEHWLERETECPFLLGRSPAWRARAVVVEETRCRLILTAHRIVTDGHGLELLAREWLAGYRGMLEKRPALARARVQFADFAVWQRAWSASEDAAAMLAFWQESLADAPARHGLPIDRPRPTVQSYFGAAISFPLDAALPAKLSSLGTGRGVDSFTILQTAFAVLLTRYSTGVPLVLGLPVSNRTGPVPRDLVGPLENILPLFLDFSEDPSFSTCLAMVRERTEEARAHGMMPVEQLVEVLQPERNLGHAPLFQIVVTEDRGLVTEPGPPRFRITAAGKPKAVYDLWLTLPAGGSGTAVLGYAADLFESETIDRMTRHYRSILENIAADSRCPISRLALEDRSSRVDFLAELNRTDAPQTGPVFVNRLFERQVRRTPSALALITDTSRTAAHGALKEDKHWALLQQWTYRELNHRANQLARQLRTLGLRQGALAGIGLERSAEMVIGMLAVLKAGGAYVPLDPTLPANRLSFMMEDTDISLLLTHSDSSIKPPRRETRVLCPDREPPAGPVSNLSLELDPDQLAYVIYTSGSTGRPKGVMVSHRAIGNRILWMNDRFPLTTRDRVFQKTPVNFDAFGWELYCPLSAGALVVLARPEGHRDPAYLCRAMAKYEITRLQVVPTLLDMLLREPSFERVRSLEYIFSGGEALSSDLCARLHSLKTVALINLYGPTEAAIDVTYCPADSYETRKYVPIGRPIANTRLYIVDDHMEPAPIGVPGHLVVDGRGLARGYLNEPGLTAVAFIPNLFQNDFAAADQGARLYLTGDRARLLPEGSIEFLGRRDDQIKLRGFRIEIGEIISMMSRFPGVIEAMAMVREDEPGERRLVAYVRVAGRTLSSGFQPFFDIASLRRAMEKSLPDYMVPTAFVALADFPRTPGGKLDRRALPAPERASGEREYVAPRNLVEETLALIWEELLHLERVGVFHNFFELGGQSLLAMHAVKRVREVFSLELAVRDLFLHPTVASLAERIEETRREERDLDIPSVPPMIPLVRERNKPPLSAYQHRLWMLERLMPDAVPEHPSVVLRLTGALKWPVLASGLRGLTRDQQVLRTTITVKDGKPRQRLLAGAGLPLASMDFDGLGLEPGSGPVRAAVEEHQRRSFDLAAEPPFRLLLIRLAPNDHLLAAVFHARAADERGVNVWVDELAARYACSAAPVRKSLRPEPMRPPVQYGDYAYWQNHRRTVGVLDGHLDFWREQLTPEPKPLELPADKPASPIRTFRGGIREFELEFELIRSFQTLAQDNDADLFMALETLFALFLARLCGQSDLAIGTPLPGRSRDELKILVGAFANPVVLRHRLEGCPDFPEALARAKQLILDARRYGEAPFPAVVEAAGTKRDLGRTPLFRAFFVQRETPLGSIGLPGLNIEPLGGVRIFYGYDLSLVFEPAGHRAYFEYNAELFSRGQIDGIADYFLDCARFITAHPERSWTDLPKPPADLAQALSTPTAEPISDFDGKAPAELETGILEIFAEVLDLEDTDANLDFFTLGGDSRTAFEVLALIKSRYGVALPPISIFLEPLPARLAALTEITGWTACSPDFMNESATDHEPEEGSL